jgi:hypothetical protein
VLKFRPLSEICRHNTENTEHGKKEDYEETRAEMVNTAELIAPLIRKD